MPSLTPAVVHKRTPGSRGASQIPLLLGARTATSPSGPYLTPAAKNLKTLTPAATR